MRAKRARASCHARGLRTRRGPRHQTRARAARKLDAAAALFRAHKHDGRRPRRFARCRFVGARGRVGPVLGEGRQHQPVEAAPRDVIRRPRVHEPRRELRVAARVRPLLAAVDVRVAVAARFPDAAPEAILRGQA